MVKNRLFTFGCSHTNYIWPTWANYIGHFYKEHHNYGKAGCGNYFALSHLYEANEKYNITKDDTVLIMLSDDNRADFIQTMGTWTATGNIYAEFNTDYFGETFQRNIWSPINGLNNSWVCAKSMKHFLDSIGCVWKIYSAYCHDEDDCQINEGKNGSHYTLGTKRKYDLVTGKPLMEYLTDKDRYSIWDADAKKMTYDGHLRLEEHLKWVKENAQEFYDEKMEELCKEWSKRIHPNINSQEFEDVRVPEHKEIIIGGELPK